VIHRRQLAILALAIFVVSGCGGDGRNKRYKVSGKVTYKGQPLKSGTIQFYPEKASGDNPGASSTITDGYYTLSATGMEGDGAYPGDYLVAIEARDTDMSQALKNAGGGAARQDDIAKAYAKSKLLTPKKYAITDTSGLKAKVEARSNSFDFELVD
jgi:hypothetical protein